MSYIGQTEHSFEIRYYKGRWWQYTDNKYLKRSVEKYGRENFTVNILEKNIENLEKLDEREIFYIKFLNTLYPDGYNFQLGGKSRSGEKKGDAFGDTVALAASGGKIYKLKNHKDNKIYEFCNIARFCRENNLEEVSIHLVLKKKAKRCHTWTLPDQELKIFKLISPEGKEYILYWGEIREFCEKFGLGPRSVSGLCCGIRRDHKGWTSDKSNFSILKKGSEESGDRRALKRSGGKIHFLKNNETGEIFKIVNIQRFCRKNGIKQVPLINRVLNRKRRRYKHWSLPEMNL